jgi:hypothetical protein
VSTVLFVKSWISVPFPSAANYALDEIDKRMNNNYYLFHHHYHRHQYQDLCILNVPFDNSVINASK